MGVSPAFAALTEVMILAVHGGAVLARTRH
jgi:hypothetical protein